MLQQSSLKAGSLQKCNNIEVNETLWGEGIDINAKVAFASQLIVLHSAYKPALSPDVKLS